MKINQTYTFLKNIDSVAKDVELDFILEDIFFNIFKYKNKSSLKISHDYEVKNGDEVKNMGFPNDFEKYSVINNVVKRIEDDRVIVQHTFGAGASGSLVFIDCEVIGMYDKVHDEDKESSYISIKLIVEKLIKFYWSRKHGIM